MSTPSARSGLARRARAVRRAVLRRRRLLAAVLTAVAVAAGLQAAAAPPAPTRLVTVAATDLPAGTTLRSADLATVELPPRSVPDGVAHDPVGQVLAAPLRAREPVTDVRLVGPALAAAYPGLTAAPVRLPDADMAALLHVGDRIDLVAADPQGAGASVVATAAPVLALPAPPAGSGAGTLGGGGLTGRLVVVGVPPADVASLADAAARSFLTFVFAR